VYTKQFIDLLDTRKDTIHKLLERTEEFADKIRKNQQRYCLCHGDIHAGNILIENKNSFYIVDWDTLIMAPKERDLMFIGGGVANKWNTKEEEEYFYAGYTGTNREAEDRRTTGRGSTGYENIDFTLLLYYRYERIIVDLVEYYEQFFVENLNEDNQRAIIERVGSVFEPGDVMDMALRTEGKIRGLHPQF
jgi:spectinomycin phosphotransferase